MATALVLPSSFLISSFFPSKFHCHPESKSRSPTCMSETQSSVAEDEIDTLQFKNYCFACKEAVESPEFHQRHILDQAVIFYDENNIKEHTCVLRNCITCDFPCPHQGCSHRDCDSEALKEHVMECEHKRVSLRPVVSSQAVNPENIIKMNKL